MKSFTDFYFDSLMEDEKEEFENEIEVDDETYDDEYAVYTDEDYEDDEELNEKLVKSVVIRAGKRMKKWRSDKDNYRVVLDKETGRPKEVRMDAAEIRTRKIAQKKAARKRKAGQAQSQVKRKISLKKREMFKNSLNLISLPSFKNSLNLIYVFIK